MEVGVGGLWDFLGVEEKRGSLWNLTDLSGPSGQPHEICGNKASLLPTALVAGNTTHI